MSSWGDETDKLFLSSRLVKKLEEKKNSLPKYNWSDLICVTPKLCVTPLGSQELNGCNRGVIQKETGLLSILFIVINVILACSFW